MIIKNEKLSLILNTPFGPSGQLLTTEVLQAAIDKLGARTCFGSIGEHNLIDGSGIDASHISHKFENIYIDGNRVFVDITILPTIHGMSLSTCYNLNKIYFNITGLGVISGERITDYTITAVNAFFNEDRKNG
jgi:hypothetical protein